MWTTPARIDATPNDGVSSRRWRNCVLGWMLPARIVVNERTGTIVMGKEVRISR